MRGPSRRQFGAMLLAGVAVPVAGAGYCSQEGCTSLRNSSAPESGPEIKWRQNGGIELRGVIRESDIAVGTERLYVSTKFGIKYIDKQTGNGLETRELGIDVFAPFQYLEMVGEDVFGAASSRSQSQRGWVVMSPAEDGEYRLGNWETPWNPVHTVGFDGSSLVVGGENRLSGFDFESGEQLWTREFPLETGLAVGENRVYVTLNIERANAYGVGPLDLETGEPIDADAFIAPTGQPLSPPVFQDGRLYVADRRTVYALSPSGDGLWQFDMGNAGLHRRTPMQFRANSLVVGGNRALGVLSPESGAREWTRRFDQRIQAWAATESAVLTLHSANGLRDTLTGTNTIVHAYDLASGQHLGWKALEESVRHVESGPEAVYLLTRRGELLALQA